MALTSQERLQIVYEAGNDAADLVNEVDDAENAGESVWPEQLEDRVTPETLECITMWMRLSHLDIKQAIVKGYKEMHHRARQEMAAMDPC